MFDTLTEPELAVINGALAGELHNIRTLEKLSHKECMESEAPGMGYYRCLNELYRDTLVEVSVSIPFDTLYPPVKQ